MPTQKGTRIYTRKRRKARYKQRYSGLAPIGKSLGFPKEKVVRMRYCESVNLTCTTGILATYQFRANGVFDPNYTLGGHQPMTYDFWSQLYNHSQVLGSKISVSAQPSADLSTSHVCGIYLSDDISTYTTWTAFQESGRSLPKTILSADRPQSLSSNFSLKKFFTKSVDNGTTSALVSTNPAEEAYYTVWLQPVDITSSSSSNVMFRVQIDYIVRFFEPKDIVQS